MDQSKSVVSLTLMRISESELQNKNSDPSSTSGTPHPKPSLALDVYQEDEEERKQKLKVIKRRSEKLCWGIFGSVVLSFIVFSLVLYSYEDQIIDVVMKRQTVNVDLWVILWCFSFVSTQPIFPGAT